MRTEDQLAFWMDQVPILQEKERKEVDRLEQLRVQKGNVTAKAVYSKHLADIRKQLDTVMTTLAAIQSE